MSPKVRGLNKAFLNKAKSSSAIIRLKREVKPDNASKNAVKKREEGKVSATV